MIELPDRLESYRPVFELTSRPAIQLKPQEAAPDLAPWESRIGGRPPLFQGAAWPVAADDSLLYFLAQLNLGLFPSIGSFPEQGCLQFFVGAKKEDTMVRYWAEISQDTSDWSVPEHAISANGPLNNEQVYSLDYTLVRELMPHSDYRFKEHIGTQLKLALEEEYWSMLKAYAGLHNGSGHKLGGFAYFPQDDPRYAWAEEKELLFQLDSDPSIQCDWGALGSGAFFISEAALGQANFSEVEFIQTRI